MKVLCVLGTRPDAVKMAPIILKLKERQNIHCIVCVTGQHREMLKPVLDLFGIVPDYNLDVMQPNQTLNRLVANLLIKIGPILQKESPDWVLVQGDTSTAMAGSLAAFHQQIPVGHIEAGLRTGNKHHPFPEEINRRITSVVCDWHFAPTINARDNLLKENVDPEHIIVTGNTVIDAFLSVANMPYDLQQDQSFVKIPQNSRVIVVTAHRRENHGQPLINICMALREIVQRNDNVHVVFPVHLNPNVQQTVYPLLEDEQNIHLIPPLDYLPFVHLLKRSYIVLTDSGGIQEEVPGLGIPVLVLRETTERPEAVEAGTSKLIGTVKQSIVEYVQHLLDDDKAYVSMSQANNPFGDGHASERIIAALTQKKVGANT